MIVASVLLLLWAGIAVAQVESSDYARAERFLSWNATKLVYDTPVDPQWIQEPGEKESDRFWYRKPVRGGHRFVYVDRIVVAPSARGRGLARRLYDELIRTATEAGHDRVVCEVNLDPPNPQSDAFHAALGFQPLATARIHGGTKTVRYMARSLR